MAKRTFSLQATGTVDLGSLKGIHAFTSFMDAWTSKAADIPILGASGTRMREQHLRLRAEVVLPTVCSLGAGADSVDAIVSTVKHLARPAQVGEARMFGAAVRDEQRIHLIPQDASCAVCGSEAITLELTRHGVPATVLLRGLDGVREATPYKKVCLECGTVHNFNEVTVPAGKHPLWEQPPAAATEGSSAELSPAAKRRCFRPDVLEQPYFRATGKTWYTREYMAWTTSLLESVQVSFDGMTRATRAVRRDEGLLDRVDRENLATAWFAREARGSGGVTAAAAFCWAGGGAKRATKASRCFWVVFRTLRVAAPATPSITVTSSGGAGVEGGAGKTGAAGATEAADATAVVVVAGATATSSAPAPAAEVRVAAICEALSAAVSKTSASPSCGVRSPPLSRHSSQYALRGDGGFTHPSAIWCHRPSRL